MRLSEWTDGESILHRLLIRDSPAWKQSENKNLRLWRSFSVPIAIKFILFFSVPVDRFERCLRFPVDLQAPGVCFKILRESLVCILMPSMEVVRQLVSVAMMMMMKVHCSAGSVCVEILRHSNTTLKSRLPVRKHILQWFVKTTFESFNFFFFTFVD